MALVQHTLISTSHNICSTVLSALIGIRYPDTYTETSKLQNNEILDLNSRTCHNGLMKNSKLILRLAGSVNNRRADNLLQPLSENHGAVPNVHNRFKILKHKRTITIGEVSGQSLRKVVATVNHISKHGLTGTMSLRDWATLIKRQIFVIQLTKLWRKANWKALRESQPTNSYRRLLLVPRL